MSQTKETREMKAEPIQDVHQLAHTELLTPVLDDSVEFFTQLLGMSIVHKEGKSVYLRAYEDVYKYSLILTESDEAGMAYSAFRTSSEQALHRRVEAIEATGQQGEWREDNYGYGPSYRFVDPDGHTIEIFWEVEKFGAGEELQSGILNRAQRRPLQGIPVRRIDHINLLTHPDKVHETHEFWVDTLGFKLREAVTTPSGEHFATWLSVSPLVHEVALMGDELGGNGRFHHLAFWYGFPQHLDDLADACKEYGIEIEAGPLKHGVSQAKCMYIIEPGGNRIELFGDSGYLIFDPDWEPVLWGEGFKEEAIIWYGGELPETYFRYGTPRIKDETDELNCYYNPIKNQLKESNQLYDVSDNHESDMYRSRSFSLDDSSTVESK
jgi:catechol 2,3-dioxygenase